MTSWLNLTHEQRIISIEQAAIRSGIIAKAIEKDWWVTITLKALFSSTYAPCFIFKGGTSLSKGWKLIDRFSEDIDIALDPQAFGYTYKTSPSHSYIKALKKAGCRFTSTVLKETLAAALTKMGVSPGMIAIKADPVPETLPDRDPQTLLVQYPSLYPPHSYIADEVKIEFSVRSLLEPFAPVTIQTILAASFPNPVYSTPAFEIPAARPMKTLLEKAFLLHEKLCCPDRLPPKGHRLSRHLYDLVKMMHTPAATQALDNHVFYQQLIAHRQRYMRLKDVDYSSLQPATLSFVPPSVLHKMFREDYAIMQREMIYETAPSFTELLDALQALNNRFTMLSATLPATGAA